jgi:hypothetical protein
LALNKKLPRTFSTTKPYASHNSSNKHVVFPQNQNEVIPPKLPFTKLLIILIMKWMFCPQNQEYDPFDDMDEVSLLDYGDTKLMVLVQQTS